MYFKKKNFESKLQKLQNFEKEFYPKLIKNLTLV